MAGPRRLRILALLSRDGDLGSSALRLCDVSAEVTGVSGAGIMLMAGEVPRGSLCTSDPVSELLERLQVALGEGPCIDAFTSDRPVAEPDLEHPAAVRWPAFSGPAVDAGARAVFGFPLQVGSVRLGALNLHADRTGSLTDDQHADAIVMAQVAAETVLATQAEAPPGQLAAALEAGSDFQYVVHQAAGMVAVQLGTSVGEAFLRLRARAFGDDQPLTEIAKAVVDRTLRFARGPGEDGPDEEEDPHG